MNIVKLSDERVREIFARVVQLGHQDIGTRPTWTQGDCEEVAALAQAVLDLRTANAMLSRAIDDLPIDE